MEILNYYEVLSKEQVEAITEVIIENQQDLEYTINSLGDFELKDFHFAFGKYVDGVCLIYIGENQNEFNESKCLKSASYAIDKSGDFISIKKNGHDFTGLDKDTYDKDNDLTILNVDFKRVLSVYGSEEISTDDFDNWFKSERLKLTNMVLYKIEYVKGLPGEYDKFDEYGNAVDENGIEIIDEKTQLESGVFCKNHNESINVICKEDLPIFTNFLIRNQFILLRSQSYDYFSIDEMIDADYPDYDRLLGSYIQKQFAENYDKPKYGVFDIIKKKILIHCGECKCVKWHDEFGIVHCQINGYINGFDRLEFQHSRIVTYDKGDITRRSGVDYSQKMTIHSGYYPVYVETGNEIIREGKNAGRNVNWLKIEDKKTLIKYIQSKYIHIHDIEYFVENLSKRTKDKIWLANDSHYLFQNITKPSDVLDYSDIYKEVSIFSGNCESVALLKHHLESFEIVVGKDPKYLVGLIECGSLIVDLSVFEELRIKKANNIKYLEKMEEVENVMRIRQEEIDEVKEMRRMEQESRKEQEELRYWQNEGYQAAFDGMADAEWNIE